MEDQTNQRTAVKHLIKNGHGKVHGPGLDPDSKILRILRQRKVTFGNSGLEITQDAKQSDKLITAYAI